MDISNLILIFVIAFIAIYLVLAIIKKNKAQQAEEVVDQDDKTYTLDRMIKFIKKRLDEITKINLYDIGLSEEELKRRKTKKYLFRNVRGFQIHRRQS